MKNSSGSMRAKEDFKLNKVTFFCVLLTVGKQH